MSIELWWPAIASSGIVTIAGIAGGYLLKFSIESGVKYAFERQIEQLRSDIRAKEEDIKSLRSGALSLMTARHEDLDRRRIKAVENLWSVVIAQRKFNLLTAFFSVVDVKELDKALDAGGDDRENAKKFVDLLWETSGGPQLVEQMPLGDVERLFVSPKAWMAWQALRIINAKAIALVGSFRAGAGTKILNDVSEMNAIVVGVLPHRAEYIAKFPDTGPFNLKKELEELIFIELTEAFNSSKQYREAVEAASDILKHASAQKLDELLSKIPPEFRRSPPELYS